MIVEWVENTPMAHLTINDNHSSILSYSGRHGTIFLNPVLDHRDLCVFVCQYLNHCNFKSLNMGPKLLITQLPQNLNPVHKIFYLYWNYSKDSKIISCPSAYFASINVIGFYNNCKNLKLLKPTSWVKNEKKTLVKEWVSLESLFMTDNSKKTNLSAHMHYGVLYFNWFPSVQLLMAAFSMRDGGRWKSTS